MLDLEKYQGKLEKSKEKNQRRGNEGKERRKIGINVCKREFICSMKLLRMGQVYLIIMYKLFSQC